MAAAPFLFQFRPPYSSSPLFKPPVSPWQSSSHFCFSSHSFSSPNSSSPSSSLPTPVRSSADTVLHDRTASGQIDPFIIFAGSSGVGSSVCRRLSVAGAPLPPPSRPPLQCSSSPDHPSASPVSLTPGVSSPPLPPSLPPLVGASRSPARVPGQLRPSPGCPPPARSRPEPSVLGGPWAEGSRLVHRSVDSVHRPFFFTK